MPPLECQAAFVAGPPPQPSGSELTEKDKRLGHSQEVTALPDIERDLGECPSSLAVSRDEQAKPELQDMLVGLKDNSQDLTPGGTQGHSREPRVPREPAAPRPRPGHQRAHHRRKGSRRRTLQLPASSGLGSVIYRPRFEGEIPAFLAPAFLVPSYPDHGGGRTQGPRP